MGALVAGAWGLGTWMKMWVCAEGQGPAWRYDLGPPETSTAQRSQVGGGDGN